MAGDVLIGKACLGKETLGRLPSLTAQYNLLFTKGHSMVFETY
jgi:hypothetical protein